MEGMRDAGNVCVLPGVCEASGREMARGERAWENGERGQKESVVIRPCGESVSTPFLLILYLLLLLNLFYS